ncbi:type II toxin-antitoxin system RelE/ParE family toxin [Kosakonia quasisacchari]|uniref:Type II toxin-antitoxin system RelE/ParE family toxin n=1 Tax=Kosakonia quasisacchari TaxID=2529380 RepID=A0A4R0GI46_9ENTR|nr:type II toxin-antitoxin system RelE/ParE family toxin [Kosakonia quasisacchari]TCB96407.1 type II toxin-antitoxin system RelE/ParE family toxin [Kosakonia quasisacchari]
MEGILSHGRNPFAEFLRGVKDPIAKAMIATRLARMATNNYGDCKPCRDGVSELRIDQGPGYRVYFSAVTDPKDGEVSLILLGGDKRKQDADITKAVEYLNDYKSRK